MFFVQFMQWAAWISGRNGIDLLSSFLLGWGVWGYTSTMHNSTSDHEWVGLKFKSTISLGQFIIHVIIEGNNPVLARVPDYGHDSGAQK